MQIDKVCDTPFFIGCNARIRKRYLREKGDGKMISVRIEEKPAFRVIGRKVWITGQDNAQFDRFWSESHANGLIDRLRALSGGQPGKVTGATTVGVSRVEKEPANRAFYFFIAAE